MIDIELAARQLLRALRGRRSQVALSRRLGFRSNVVHTWECGRRWPTASETFRLAKACRVSPEAALAAWYRTPPAWLAELDPTAPAAIARFLQHERGSTPLGTIAQRAGSNRYSVARWLNGTTEPRLPDFLRLVEACSLRVVELLVHLVGPEGVPAAAAAWHRREARRTAVLERPWSQAVLRALDVPAYRAGAERLAEALKLPPELVEDALGGLEGAGQVRRLPDGSLAAVRVDALDTRRDEASARRLKGFWSAVASERWAEGEPGEFAYNVFSVSRAQLARLVELQQAHWRAVRAIVAEDEPPEVVALLNLQLLRLDRG